MEGRCQYSSSSSSWSSFGSAAVGPMCPKSPPPGGLDLDRKRRQTLKVQFLEREIDLLEEELKSLEGLQPASWCCKELDTFIGSKPEPFIATNPEIHKSGLCSWRRIWAKFCLNLPWICCFSCCRIHLEMPNCCTSCRSSNFCSRLKKINCGKCCRFLDLSSPTCSCCWFKMFR